MPITKYNTSHFFWRMGDRTYASHLLSWYRCRLRLRGAPWFSPHLCALCAQHLIVCAAPVSPWSEPKTPMRRAHTHALHAVAILITCGTLVSPFCRYAEFSFAALEFPLRTDQLGLFTHRTHFQGRSSSHCPRSQNRHLPRWNTT